ncbi:MAG: alanine racemase [Paludibacteraceae bacterium]|nr:alanine racemase [Paludibacteraceae bacterium]
MRLSEIIAIIGRIAHVDVRTQENLDIKYLLTDSRQLGNDPEHTMFFALKTSKNDGAKYIEELYRQGVSVFVTGNSLEALQTLAAYKRQCCNCPVIGITGSNGKTVVKEWLYELLKDDYKIVRSPKSYNSQIGVPLSVWQMDQTTELAIFEAGISEPGEMEKLERIIRPTIGVITYIGEEHSANFPSLEAKRAEKVKLFKNCATVIEDPTHQNVRTCASVMRALGYDEDTIALRIMRQTHETTLQVNLSALTDNVRYFRSYLKPETKLTCMVKAFAYGSGSVEVSLALQESRMVDYLAVAVADEGVELRRAGVTLPIIIMDPEEGALDLIMENNLEPNIYSFPVLESFMNAAARRGLEDYPIHIKIDSGMHRLGFYEGEIDLLTSKLQTTGTCPVKVKSVFSHLAGADEEQWDEFTKEQIQYFDRCAERLKAQLGYPVMKHILNSAGIERFSDYQFDMCRLGIGLYGFSAIGKQLRNVCTLKTTILSVKTVPGGASIGYGRHTVLEQDRQIAVIPIGYADGFDRRFSNYGGEVVVRGVRCPVVGNVCMDQVMIDVTGTDAQPGDQAIIFGDQLPIEELADKLGTITYEILTSVSRRVQRIYYKD